ncbi:MAG: 16S rRNA (guanine(527)-N(7))-methyltransferase RsmG [Acidobacteriota bacterium]|jgi:16S rRNA (guanine527-N7)-methyltransferase
MTSTDPRLKVLREGLAGLRPALTAEQIDHFAHYYGLVLKWNSRLHLTTLTEPDQFLSRHIAEVCAAVGLIDAQVTGVWDLGSGLGVPGLPLRILRPDLDVLLVEASRKKAIFLETVIAELGLTGCRVACQRIEDLPAPTADLLLTARAVEQMEELLPRLLELAVSAGQLILFISPDLARLLPGATIYPLPGAQQRCLASLKCST